MFVLTNERYKTYQTGFSSCPLGHAPGVGLWGVGGAQGVKINFKHGHVAYQIDGDDEQNRFCCWGHDPGVGLGGAVWVKNFSVGICDGAPSTAHSSFVFLLSGCLRQVLLNDNLNVISVLWSL